MFISFEGTDGAGKSLQSKKFKEYLESNGHSVTLLRDPGTTKIGEGLRNILLDKNNTEMCNKTEALIYAGARAQMVYELILPALQRGEIIICDRYIDSNLVYQGISRKLGIEEIYDLNMFATGNLLPDITFVLELPTEIGLKRKNNDGELDRLELENKEFFESIRNGYIEISKIYSDRIKLINANRTIDEIFREIKETYIKFLKVNAKKL
ncbi:MAG: dTMP kinase [Lachnospirales bacterium]